MYFQCRYLVQKFSKELKRVMIKMPDESVSIINTPWTVSTIPGTSNFSCSHWHFNQKNNNATLGLEFMRRLESRKKKKHSLSISICFQIHCILHSVVFKEKHVQFIFGQCPQWVWTEMIILFIRRLIIT